MDKIILLATKSPFHSQPLVFLDLSFDILGPYHLHLHCLKRGTKCLSFGALFLSVISEVRILRNIGDLVHNLCSLSRHTTFSKFCSDSYSGGMCVCVRMCHISSALLMVKLLSFLNLQYQSFLDQVSVRVEVSCFSL